MATVMFLPVGWVDVQLKTFDTVKCVDGVKSFELNVVYWRLVALFRLWEAFDTTYHAITCMCTAVSCTKEWDVDFPLLDRTDVKLGYVICLSQT